MITMEKVKAFGADTQEGLTRCMNNEAFYLRLVGKFIEKNAYNDLKTAILANDLDEAFRQAHSLKGVLGNLSLTPLFELMVEITELLRVKTQMDYLPLLEKYESLYNSLIS